MTPGESAYNKLVKELILKDNAFGISEINELKEITWLSYVHEEYPALLEMMKQNRV
jgi:hypothetical protein